MLLLKRPDKITPDKTTSGIWSVPGLEVEFMENVEDAVKREVREEIGVEIKIVKHRPT
jgi:ADP-ribose pyrophosphatase YjhB (NUDIX family)